MTDGVLVVLLQPRMRLFAFNISQTIDILYWYFYYSGLFWCALKIFLLLQLETIKHPERHFIYYRPVGLHSLPTGLLPGLLSVWKGCLVSINGSGPHLLMVSGSRFSSPPAWWPQAGPGPLWPGAGLCWACVYYTGTRSCHALGKAVWQQIWTLCPFCSGQFDHSREKIKFSIGINIEIMRAGNCSRWPNTGTSLDWRFPK